MFYNKTVVVADHVEIDYRDPEDIVKKISEAMDKTPDQYRDSLDIEFENPEWSDMATHTLHILYERPSNAEEIQIEYDIRRGVEKRRYEAALSSAKRAENK